MNGKDKCRILKQIRQQIADANDIEYITRECTFQGECRGTCPKCEAELRYLEEQLAERRKRGAKVAVAAVAAGVMLTTTTSCDLPEKVKYLAEDLFTNKDTTGSVENEAYMLEGDVVYVDPDGDEYDPPEAIAEPTMGEPPAIDYELTGDVAYDPESEIAE